jgi:hypothetical protein
MLKKWGNVLFKTAVIIVLVLNIILFTRLLGIIYLPGEMTPLERARQGAQAVINYSEELAASYGVDKQKTVRDILAKFKYELEKADNAEDVASLVIDYGRQTQDTIFREVQSKRINTVFSIINSQKLPETGKITISRIGEDVKFLDPGNILTTETKEKIKTLPFNQTIEIEIKDQRASLVPTGDIFNQVDYLQTKVASLERQLKVMGQRSGYEPISGPGIVIEVHDNAENVEYTSIVHDQDIRNIVNELKAAGARGIEVGGQRLTVHTAIRCVGPTILVNNKPIPVNPVTVKAIGDISVLTSSLDIIKRQLKNFGIRIDIKPEQEISLNGQSNYER